MRRRVRFVEKALDIHLLTSYIDGGGRDMLAELALTVAMAGSVGTQAWQTMADRQEKRSSLMSHKARSTFATVDYGITEYSLRDAHIGESNPIAQHWGARAALQAARIVALTRGLDELERAGASQRVLHGLEWGLVGHDAYCVLNNALVLAGAHRDHPGRDLIISTAVSAAVGAIINR
jgi:hypothetical protein